MPRKRIVPYTIQEAVEMITPYLLDTSNATHMAIYFDGWSGLAASTVLRAIAKEPPPHLMKRFNKIIHIDCSRWKSRRALQRTIVQELGLPHHVMDLLDRQDEDDDFRGVDEGSRSEIQDVGAEINGAIREHKCLFVFNNGSENTIDLNDFGIHLSVWGSTRVLWTFRGRLRLNSEISQKVDTSHLYLHNDKYNTHFWKYLLKMEAMEIIWYTDELEVVVEECFLYLLLLNSRGGNIIDFNWPTHASNYWVCDGIIEIGQTDKTWEVAAALHQEIHTKDYLSNALPSFGYTLYPRNRWVLSRKKSIVRPETTSFFLAADTHTYDSPLRSLPNAMFHQSDKLRVLKLCHCTFSFSLPPFRCCRNLRFLGLDGCKDQEAEDIEMEDIAAMDFLKSLWVLDICCTDWELALSSEIIEKVVANIREIHINKGRFWHMSFAWIQLQKLHKLQVIDPTSSWEMRGKDGFAVLPSLSRSNSLKTLVLDGCLGLELVEGLPQTLESFSLDAGPRKEAKIISISVAGCARLYDFKLHGSLPNLEELDLSGTKVKKLDLRTKVVQVPCLQRVILLGCEQLCAVLWPECGVPQLSLLCIDNRGGKYERVAPDLHKMKKGHGQVYISMVDMKYIQLLVQAGGNRFWNADSKKFSINICISTSGRWCNNEKMGPRSSGKLSRPRSLSPKHSYTSVIIKDINIDHVRDKSEVQFQPWGYHVEIGEGISNTSTESIQGIKTVIFVMNKSESLHVHDNSSITTVIPANMISVVGKGLPWGRLKHCHVVRCPKMHTVFTTYYNYICFRAIETFCAADLLMAHCIWSRGRMIDRKNTRSFAKLQSIHLYSCPRLIFVLPLSWAAPHSYFPNLEILHIVNCGDLKDVFLIEPEFQRKITTDRRKGLMGFPKLKQIYLHDLPSLHHICGTKMLAPMLETIRLRSCWSLRRLPSLGRDNWRHPIVDCEQEWWEKLEWDGIEAGHDPSLFVPHHSSHYKNPLPRVSMLR